MTRCVRNCSGDYSFLNAVTGDTLATRRAGSQAATAVTPTNVIDTTTRVVGSIRATLKSCEPTACIEYA